MRPIWGAIATDCWPSAKALLFQIHAPREERNLWNMPETLNMPLYFNICAPHGAQRRKVKTAIQDIIFQSMRPVRGRLRGRRDPVEPIMGFQYTRPKWGATAKFFVTVLTWISTHKSANLFFECYNSPFYCFIQ